MEVIVARQVYTVEKRVDKASERPYTRVNNSTSALVSQPCRSLRPRRGFAAFAKCFRLGTASAQ